MPSAKCRVPRRGAFGSEPAWLRELCVKKDNSLSREGAECWVLGAELGACIAPYKTGQIPPLRKFQVSSPKIQARLTDSKKHIEGKAFSRAGPKTQVKVILSGIYQIVKFLNF